MRRRSLLTEAGSLVLLLTLILGSGTAFSQFIPLTGSTLVNSSNQPATGTLTLCPVTSDTLPGGQPGSKGVPMAYHVGSGGVSTAACTIAQVTAGAFSTVIADVAHTNPLYVCFRLSFQDPTTSQEDLPNLTCVQPSEDPTSNAVKSGFCTSTGCNLDNYNPQLPAQGQIQVGPTGKTGPAGPPGAVGGVIVGRTIEASTQTGAPDACAQLQVADAMLGAGPGTIRYSQPGTCSSNITLASNHSLELAAAWTANGTVTLGNGGSVACHLGASQITASVTPFAVVGSDGNSIGNCSAGAADPTKPKLYLLSATGGATNVQVRGNYVREMLEVYAANVTGLNVANDTDVVTNFTGNQAAVGLFYTFDFTVTSERYTGTGHGVQWWGGDANLGWIPPGGSYTDSTQAMVKSMGPGSITGVNCRNINGACVWGSMGRDIVVTGVSCNGTGDMCVDTEGGVHNSFQNVEAQNYGNFCAAVFFQSLDVSFDHLKCDGGSQNFNILFALKHSGGTLGPNHEDVRITNSTFRCYSICQGIYDEGHSYLSLENDKFFDAVTVFTNFSYNADFRHLLFRFDGATAGLNITAMMLPTTLGSSTINVDDVVIRNDNPTASGSVGIGVTWSDFNTPDFYNFSKLDITGFGTDLSTSNAGTNVGPTAFPRAIWNIKDSYFHDGTLVHSLGQGGGGNDTYNVYPDNRMDVAGSVSIRPLYGELMPNNMDERVVGAATPTAATAGATATTTLALPLALGDSNAFRNGQYVASCAIMASQGAPQVTGASLAPDMQHVAVTIQAITGAAAGGQLSCRITH